MEDKVKAVSGTITRFQGNGRKLGYPTANLDVQTDARDGVYFGFAELAEFSHHPSLIFVGIPTTVGDTSRRVEIHLLDIPDVDYYGQGISATLDYYYRPNKTFSDVKALLAVMRTDEVAARRWFATAN